LALYIVGADTAKHLLLNRLNGDTDNHSEERKVHFSEALEESYYQGLVAET
jgi:phage terminase large subunit GpA-like protein